MIRSKSRTRRAAAVGKNPTPSARSEHHRSLRAILLLTLVLAVVPLAAGALSFLLFFRPYGAVATPVAGALNKAAPGSFMDGGPQRVLILGIDARKNEPSRTDTILMLRVKKGGIGLLSIPRDTRTGIPGYGMDKINHAFAYGGPKLTEQAVANLTGIDVQNYIVVRMEGVKEIVDALGGVRINVPQAMTRKVLGENREITLEPGEQVLNGDQALVYVRWRWDGRGDIGRVERQQDFLKQVVRQALAPSHLADLPAARKAAFKNIDTNMSKVELLQLAGSIRALERSGAPEHLAMVPGEAAMMYSPQMGMELSYWVPDRRALQKALEDTVR